MLRDPVRSFRSSQDDIHVPLNFLREYGLQSGHRVKLRARCSKERDKFITTAEILEAEGIPVADWKVPTDFDKLTPLFPDRRVYLEGNGPDLLFAYGQYYHSIKNYRLALLFVQQSLVQSVRCLAHFTVERLHAYCI